MKYQLNELVAVKQKGAVGPFANRLYYGYIRKAEITDKGITYWIHFGPNDTWCSFIEEDVEFEAYANQTAYSSKG